MSSGVGVPQFQYKVPNHDWYIITTSGGRHFYFDSVSKKSYWQLSDVQQHFSGDWPRFLESIDLEEISILVAKTNGLKLEYDDDTKKQKETKKLKNHKVDNPKDNKDEGKADEINESNDNENDKENNKENNKEERASDVSDDDQLEDEDDIDTEARDAFLANMLSEEGFMPQAVVSGYSSSEEESEGEEPEKQQEEGDETWGQNNGLDLSVSDTETDARAAFIELLDSFGDQISIYNPWAMVEEELIEQLVKYPEFYALNFESREAIFNEWAQTKSAPEQLKTPVPPLLQFYHLLQDYKSDIKKLYYQEFVGQHLEEVISIDLSKRAKEDAYIKFKVMITDFSNYERQTKKSKNYNPQVNLKKAALEEFLQHSSVEPLESNQVNEILESTMTPFEKWIALIEKAKIPREVCQDCKNFIVGDEKRLECYSNKVKKDK